MATVEELCNTLFKCFTEDAINEVIAEENNKLQKTVNEDPIQFMTFEDVYSSVEESELPEKISNILKKYNHKMISLEIKRDTDDQNLFNVYYSHV